MTPADEPTTGEREVTRPREVKPEEALTVRCPRCQAAPNEPCTTTWFPPPRRKEYPCGERYSFYRDTWTPPPTPPFRLGVDRMGNVWRHYHDAGWLRLMVTSEKGIKDLGAVEIANGPLTPLLEAPGLARSLPTRATGRYWAVVHPAFLSPPAPPLALPTPTRGGHVVTVSPEPSAEIERTYRLTLTAPHTIGDLFDRAGKAVDEGHAQEFLAAYRAVSEHADVNLGYVIGYAEPRERRQALYEAFNLSHPIIGGRP